MPTATTRLVYGRVPIPDGIELRDIVSDGPNVAFDRLGERRDLGAGVDRGRLDADGGHGQPPVTGGKKATSSPGRTGASGVAKSWFTAQRTGALVPKAAS